MNLATLREKLPSSILRDPKWSAGLAAIAAFSGLATLWQLQDVARSEYYAAIARSMSVSFSNFFFGAIDPAGTVTLDKIPGSYWVPAIFVKIFGFSTWAITAPNAIATIALVVVVAYTAKNLFGKMAGLLAGAVVATTPIVIAVSRSNQPQSFFLLTIAIAGFYAAKALQNSSRRYLVVSGVWIAIAFHTYMLVAWALWPALIVAWFFTSAPLLKKIVDLAIAGFTSLILSLSWILIVAIVPAGHRPYIGGTYRNNPFEMVFGYNGLGRFSATTSALSSTSDDPTFRSFTPPFGGPASVGRIFSSAVAGQIAWLIPTAIASILILTILKVRKALVIFYSLWLVTFFFMFSLVAGIHQFYTSSLAIPVAILVAGAVTMAIREVKHWHIVLLLNIAALSLLYISSLYSGYMKWVSYLQVGLVLALVAVIFTEVEKVRKFLLPIAVIVGVVLTPAAWSIDAQSHTNSINPIAGNADAMGAGGPQGGTRDGHRNFPGNPPQGLGNLPNGRSFGGNFGEQDSSEAIAYLKANRGGAKFLLVTFGAQSAASYITATGENVLPVGGFDGQDPTPTLAAFKELVSQGDVKYVLVGGGQGRGGAVTNSEISDWVKINCSLDSAAPMDNHYVCRG